MMTGRIAVLFDKDSNFTDRIIWYLYLKNVWRFTEHEWIDGDPSKGYYATITGNRFVVDFLTKRKYSIPTPT